MNPRRIALMLIDVQRDFWQPLKKHPEFASFPRNVGALLSEARARGLTIVHTQASFRPDRSDWMLFYRPQGRGDVPCIEGTEGASFEDFAAPLPDEPVVKKQTFDGFAGTDLERVLEERGVNGALLAGLETSVCVLFTATSAYLRRIVPLVVSDACADEPSRHEATLRMYGDLCFKTVTTADVRDEWASVVDLVEQFAYG
jgi:nicotinamidase-related amidase